MLAKAGPLSGHIVLSRAQTIGCRQPNPKAEPTNIFRACVMKVKSVLRSPYMVVAMASAAIVNAHPDWVTIHSPATYGRRAHLTKPELFHTGTSVTKTSSRGTFSQSAVAKESDYN